MTENQANNSPFVSVRLELSSRDGELGETALILGGSPEDRVSAPVQLPPAIWDTCRDWYQHLEAMWILREEGLKYWQQKHHELVAETAGILRGLVLPSALHQRLIQYLKQADCESLLIEVCTDHQRLDYLPLELLGQPDWGAGTNVVVWRCRTGQVQRRPVLRFLAARSAPVDVSLPQNEKEIAAIGACVSGRGGQQIGPAVLSNCTYDEFIIKTQEFRPGVVHLATHGTLDSFLFNSPPSNDPVKYDSLARYFGRSPSVSTVVSTACFSARPSGRSDERGVCFSSELIEQGMSAAVGMASKITPRAAQVFCERLYSLLGEAWPIVNAYAQAVLAVRNMREYDRLLWSVPIMCAKSSNIIPFPNRGYFDLLEQLQDMVERIEGLRGQLNRLPALPRRNRMGEAGGLSLDVAAILQDLEHLQTIELPSTSATAVWHKQLAGARRTLAWSGGTAVARLSQGQGLDQISSVIKVALSTVEELVADQYPVAVN